MSERVLERGAVFRRCPTDIPVAWWQCQRLLIYCFLPRGLVTQLKVNKQALLYLSLSLKERMSSSNAQVSVSPFSLHAWGSGSFHIITIMPPVLLSKSEIGTCHIVNRGVFCTQSYLNALHICTHICMLVCVCTVRRLVWTLWNIASCELWSQAVNCR